MPNPYIWGPRFGGYGQRPPGQTPGTIPGQPGGAVNIPMGGGPDPMSGPGYIPGGGRRPVGPDPRPGGGMGPGGMPGGRPGMPGGQTPGTIPGQPGGPATVPGQTPGGGGFRMTPPSPAMPPRRPFGGPRSPIRYW